MPLAESEFETRQKVIAKELELLGANYSFKEAKFLPEVIGTLQNTENFAEGALMHIFAGNINRQNMAAKRNNQP